MTAVEDLARHLEAAYRAIEEVDEDLRAGRISEADHAELRKRAEGHAARLVAQVERARETTSGDLAAPSVHNRRYASPRRTAIVGGGAVAIFIAGVLVGVILDRSWTPQRGPLPALMRPATPVTVGVPVPAGPGDRAVGPARIAPTPVAGAPGQPPTPSGHPPIAGVPGQSTAPPHPAMTTAPAALNVPPPAPSAKLIALEKELGRDGTPTAKFLAFARLALEEQQRGAALAAYKHVLGKEPRNAEAIAGIGVILHDGNFVDQALTRFDQALAVDPKLAVAHWHRAQILLEAKQDYAGAIKAGEAFLVLVPRGPDAERARRLVAEARERVSHQPAATPAASEASR